MNYLQLTQRLHRELGRSGAGPTAFATATKDHLRLFDWINDAWRNIQTEAREWKWMRRQLEFSTNLVTTAYTGSAAGAADFGRWRRINDDYTVRAYLAAAPTNVWRLTYLPLDQYRRLYEDVPPAAAKPDRWTIDDAERLVITPPSNVVYKVRADYQIAPQDLDEDADIPDMPSEYHILLVWKALMEGGMYDAAPEVLTRAGTNHRDMRSRLEVNQGQEIIWNMRPLC